MDLISIILALVIVGVILWLIQTYLPIDPRIKMIISAVVVIFVIVWLLQSVGLLGSLRASPSVTIR